MSDVDELWHNDRNIIITAKKQVNAQQCFQYLRKNMSSFSKESKFFIITGHHHDGLDESNVAVVGETDAEDDGVDTIKQVEPLPPLRPLTTHVVNTKYHILQTSSDQ